MLPFTEFFLPWNIKYQSSPSPPKCRLVVSVDQSWRENEIGSLPLEFSDSTQIKASSLKGQTSKLSGGNAGIHLSCLEVWEMFSNNIKKGNFLAVLWLWHEASTARGPDSLVRERRSYKLCSVGGGEYIYIKRERERGRAHAHAHSNKGKSDTFGYLRINTFGYLRIKSSLAIWLH